MNDGDLTASKSRDWVNQPIGLFVWWVLPVIVAMAASSARLPLRMVAFVWAGAFVWMGTGCLLNALRCRRLHCYVSGPVLWVGAAAMASIGFGSLSGRALAVVLWTTAGLVTASFVPEIIWDRYRAR
ncbi:MAG: hypothetical protein ACREHF_03655 [Rhizomicrobium sp.]